ncbi:MAG TPA: hypothetical protein VEY71_07095 [Chitinophagales bacterium]|nr:hypothetical protein [Chitinophagales bacterium]
MTTQTDIRESLKTFLPAYPSSSKVWIYQSARALTDEEAAELENKARSFTSEWAAHGSALDATARFVFNRFLVLAVNPGRQDASGCSIDNSVRFIQSLEAQYNTLFFERTEMAVHHEGNLVLMPLNNLKQAVRDASLPQDALLFDNTVTTLGDLRSNWITPVYTSWIAK